jgi:hypothetical protein
MPLGSESALGLAGPNGTPLIAELPAPADPAGGVSCAKACADTITLPSANARTSAELRDIEVSPGPHLQRNAGLANRLHRRAAGIDRRTEHPLETGQERVERIADHLLLVFEHR